jgi:cardiolipin synthase
MDVAVEDEDFGAAMDAKYLEDLSNSTEIVLGRRRVVVSPPPEGAKKQPPRRTRRRRGGSTSRAAAGALRIGNTFGAAISAKRPMGPSEAVLLVYGALLAIGLGIVGFMWPRVLSVPLGVIAVWLGLSWTFKAWALYRKHRQEA